MRITEIQNKGDSQKYIIIDSDEDIQDTDPFLYMCSYGLFSFAHKLKVLDSNRHNVEYYSKKAQMMAIEMVLSYIGMPLPSQFKKILFVTGKNAQKKLLRNFSYKTSEFITFLLFAGSNGFTFSQYLFERGAPEELKDRIPVLIDASADPIKTIGETDLSDSALHHVVDENKRIIAKFLTKGEKWVCFYSTTKGLAGKEPGEIGSQSHMHFISSDFGISKEKIIIDLKNGKTPSNGIHVRLINYPFSF